MTPHSVIVRVSSELFEIPHTIDKTYIFILVVSPLFYLVLVRAKTPLILLFVCIVRYRVQCVYTIHNMSYMLY